MSVLCALVGASFQVAAAAEVIRRKVGISAVGDAKVSTAQSQFGGASALFDGTGDYLLLSDENTFRASNPGDLTFECWFYSTSFSKIQPLFSKRQSNGGAGEWELQIQTNGTALGIVFGTGSGGNIFLYSTTTFSLNTWYHIAMVRNGSTWSLYVNGTSEASNTETTTPTVSSTAPLIGTMYGYSTTRVMTGNIDEVRISNTARYTAGFTPSTTPFTNDADTLLLIHMDGTNASTFFEDDNGVRSPKGISAFGDAQVSTAQSKFGGSSAKFDGTGDYLLTAPGNYDLSGDFTLECWFYQNSGETARKIFDARGAASAQGGNGTLTLADVLMIDNAGGSVGGTYRIRFFVDGAERNSTPQSHTNLAWHHMAIVRSGTTFTFYVNGVSYGSYTQSPVKNYSSILSDFFQSIGSTNGTSGFWNGWLEEFRISNTARYTANFTAPTQPHVNDANTLLLLHMDGTNASTVFRDDVGVRAPVGVSAVGNAKVSTAQSKFGGASLYLQGPVSGSGDYLVFSPISSADLSDNFTIECWFNPNDVSKNNKIFDARGIHPNFTGGGTGLIPLADTIVIDHNGSNLRIFLDGSNRASSATLTNNTWFHVIVQRTAGAVNAWLNGSRIVNSYSFNKDLSNMLTINQPIGVNASNSSNRFDYWNGYIDEFRISDIARYAISANITIPTTPFVNDDNTLLLLHMDGTNGSTTFVDDTGVAPDYEY